MRGAPARGPLTHPDESRSDTRHSYLGKRSRPTSSSRRTQTGTPGRNGSAARSTNPFLLATSGPNAVAVCGWPPHRYGNRNDTERNEIMKLKPTTWLPRARDRRPPVLLAVTPPRTGDRTLLGVENMLGSIGIPEPFSLELAGDADGVTLMARCMNDRVVRGQIAASYPQAHIQEIAPEDDPLRLGEDEQAWSMALRSDGAEYAPLRVFRDDDLIDPGSDPLIALMGALANLNERERIVARLMLRSLGPDWSKVHQEKIHGRPAEVRRDSSQAGQTGGGRTEGMHTWPSSASELSQPAAWLHVGTRRRDLEGGPPGCGTGRRPCRCGMGMEQVEGVALARLRPADGEGEDQPHGFRGGGAGDHDPAPQRRAAACTGVAGAGRRGLPPLRQPGRRPPEGQQSPSRHHKPGGPSPLRAGPVRPAQRIWRPRGGLPLASAGRPRRDSAGLQ